MGPKVLETKDIEKTKVLGVFFALLVTGQIGLQGSQVPEIVGRSGARTAYLQGRRAGLRTTYVD